MSENDNADLSAAVMAESDDGRATKEKVVVDSLRGEVTHEDASRSNLHYGDDEDPEMSRDLRDAQIEGGAADAVPPASEPRPDVSDTPNGGTDDTSTDVGASRDDSAPQMRDNEATDLTGPASADADTFQVPGDSASPGTFAPTPADPDISPQMQTAPPVREDNAQSGARSKDAEEALVAPNEAPTQLTLDAVELAENDAGAVVGQLSVVDPNAADQHVFSISDDRFEVVGGQVRLKPGVALDHEEQASIRFDITATDANGASLTETFEITVADVNEAPTAISVDQSMIATGQPGAVIGQITVTDPDQEASYEFTLSDDRFEVSEGQLKLREDVSLGDEDIGALAVEITVSDQGGETFTQSFDFGVVETASTEVKSGFHARYFDVDHSLSRLDQIDWSAEATHEEITGEINYTNSRDSFWEGGSRDTFGAQITGNIEVEEGGTFEFFVGGDDGVVLLINGEEVIDNDGLHGFRTRSGEVELEPGTHTIEVRYFENYGHAGLKVEWDGPGTDGRELVTAPGAEDLQTVNGVPIALELEVSVPETAAPDQVSHGVEGLPVGTILNDGETTVEIGPEGSADISGMDLSLMTMTTPVEFTGQVSAKIVTTTNIGEEDAVSVTTNLEFNVNQAVITAPDVGLETGFRASYFDVDHRLSRLDDIDWSGDATHEEVVGEIDYTNSRESFWDGGSRDTFGVRITGKIEVEEGGTFDFFLGGDDGAILIINGEEVIDNDGLHGYRTRTGEMDLEPGTHDIEVRYFENYGHAGLKLEWEGPGLDGRELVSAQDELAVPQNGMIALGIDDDALTDAASITVSGLPADTILMSGDNVAVSEGGEIDLSGWDLSLLELAPPPGFEGQISVELSTTDTAFNGQIMTGQTEFRIDVGDIENAQQSAGSSETADTWASHESETGSASWVEGAENDEAEEQDDDPLSEEVIGNEGAEQTHEMNETYERQDW